MSQMQDQPPAPPPEQQHMMVKDAPSSSNTPSNMVGGDIAMHYPPLWYRAPEFSPSELDRLSFIERWRHFEALLVHCAHEPINPSMVTIISKLLSLKESLLRRGDPALLAKAYFILNSLNTHHYNTATALQLIADLEKELKASWLKRLARRLGLERDYPFLDNQEEYVYKRLISQEFRLVVILFLIINAMIYYAYSNELIPQLMIFEGYTVFISALIGLSIPYSRKNTEQNVNLSQDSRLAQDARLAQDERRLDFKRIFIFGMGIGVIGFAIIKLSPLLTQPLNDLLFNVFGFRFPDIPDIYVCAVLGITFGLFARSAQSLKQGTKRALAIVQLLSAVFDKIVEKMITNKDSIAAGLFDLVASIFRSASHLIVALIDMISNMMRGIGEMPRQVITSILSIISGVGAILKGFGDLLSGLGTGLSKGIFKNKDG